MRLIICQILVIAVLFMSTEGAWDMANESHPHSDKLAHQVDEDQQAPIDPDPLSDGNGSHCEHLCYGHLTSITADTSHFGLPAPGGYFAFHSTPLSSRLQAPPTPPPNI